MFLVVGNRAENETGMEGLYIEFQKNIGSWPKAPPSLYAGGVSLYPEEEDGDLMANMSETRATVWIEEPKAETVCCVECGREIARHVAHKVTVELRRPISGLPHTFRIWNTADPWQRSWQTWSAAAQARLNAAATMFPSAWPEPTHEIETNIGYGCSREHAEAGARSLGATIGEQ